MLVIYIIKRRAFRNLVIVSSIINSVSCLHRRWIFIVPHDCCINPAGYGEHAPTFNLQNYCLILSNNSFLRSLCPSVIALSVGIDHISDYFPFAAARIYQFGLFFINLYITQLFFNTVAYPCSLCRTPFKIYLSIHLLYYSAARCSVRNMHVYKHLSTCNILLPSQSHDPFIPSHGGWQL